MTRYGVGERPSARLRELRVEPEETEAEYGVLATLAGEDPGYTPLRRVLLTGLGKLAVHRVTPEVLAPYVKSLLVRAREAEKQPPTRAHLLDEYPPSEDLRTKMEEDPEVWRLVEAVATHLVSRVFEHRRTVERREDRSRGLGFLHYYE